MRAGEILGDRYMLERVLGQGGMGVVWAARDRTNGLRVAIKLLLDDGTSENNPAHEKYRKELRQRLRREAEACMKLADHPNVVRVFDLSMDDTDHYGPYIVMEMLEGESLQDHLKRKRSLEPKVAAFIAADVSSCLTAAHAAKLVHRDLKPANIYLHREPGMAEEFITKVLDFGVCKDGDSVEMTSDHTPTMTGMVLGSIAYMSPQQAMGSKNVDFRTDIWSVGVMLYELLTGLRAFSGSVNDIIAMYGPILIGKTTTPPVPPPSSRMRNIPPELDAVVERCTKPKPADRYASAEELARDLYAIAGQPMPVIPSARPSSSVKSPIDRRELIDLYESAIIKSKAVPAAHDERRFNQFARTIPLKRAFDQQNAAPAVVEEKVVLNVKPPSTTDVLMFAGQKNVPDLSDVDVTVRLPPKNALAPMSRPPLLNEPPPDAGVRTQFLTPSAPILSPMPDLSEMHRALEEHRKSSISIPIPDLSELDAPGGGTQMLMADKVALPPKPLERSATTSVAMSQTMGRMRLPSVPFDAAGTTSRRRRRTRGVLVVAGVVFAGALALLMVVIVTRSQRADSAVVPPPTSSTILPKASLSTDANGEKPPTQPPATPENVPTVAPAVSSAGVAKPLPRSSTSVSKPPIAPTVKVKPPLPPTSSTKCTGKGIFTRCDGKPASTMTWDL